MSLKHLDDERSDDTLEPRLTALDKRVLEMLPAIEYYTKKRGLTKWEVAQALKTEDVAGVRQQLDGLVHLHYAVKGNTTGTYYLSYRGQGMLAGDGDEPDPQQEAFSV